MTELSDLVESLHSSDTEIDELVESLDTDTTRSLSEMVNDRSASDE